MSIEAVRKPGSGPWRPTSLTALEPLPFASSASAFWASFVSSTPVISVLKPVNGFQTVFAVTHSKQTIGVPLTRQQNAPPRTPCAARFCARPCGILSRFRRRRGRIAGGGPALRRQSRRGWARDGTARLQQIEVGLYLRACFRGHIENCHGWLNGQNVAGRGRHVELHRSGEIHRAGGCVESVLTLATHLFFAFRFVAIGHSPEEFRTRRPEVHMSCK
jgi:hypothetical protein